MVEKTGRQSQSQSRGFALHLSFLLVLLVGIIDLETGPELSVAILYLLPIASASWFGGRGAGLVFAALATIAWFIAELLAGRVYSDAWILYWNSLVRLIVFSIFSYLVAKVRYQLDCATMRAQQDFLTGLPNNQFFFELAAQEMKLASGFHPVTLAYIKVDGLAWINRRFGIVAGDQLVCAIAQTIKTKVPRQDLVGRLGGTLFGILLPDTGSDAANLILEKIQKGLVEQRRRYHQPVTFFISAVSYTKSPRTVAELMHEAERRLSQVRDAKKDTLRIEVAETLQPLT